MPGVSVACPRLLVGGSRGRADRNSNAGADAFGNRQSRLGSLPWPAGLTVAVPAGLGQLARRR